MEMSCWLDTSAVMSNSDTPDDYAALHAHVRRLLRQLKRLDFERLPELLRAQLLEDRVYLEALLDATDPGGVPLLESVFRSLRRPLPAEELWAIVRHSLKPRARPRRRSACTVLQ